MRTFIQKLDETKNYISKKIKIKPRAGIIAGSGLGCLRDNIKNPVTIKYSDIPHFPKSGVAGHSGELVAGLLSGVPVVILNGRVHYYEGYMMEDAVYGVAALKWLGVSTVIVTAAVGAINKKYSVGDIVILKDHINFTGENPLRGLYSKELGERFPDISNVYDGAYRREALKAAKRNKITVHEGVYFGVQGPSYETPAEIRAFRKLGGDVVGMSVVSEVIMAGELNMKTIGLAYAANKASGVSSKRLKHEDVLKAGEKASRNIAKIIGELVTKL
jgi:purine-nucleoside phosphorylase